MARAVISDPKGRSAYEPLYDIDPRTGASIEVFYADHVLAGSFGTRGAGWFWWSCKPGFLPDGPPSGPFATSYSAYRDWIGERLPLTSSTNSERSDVMPWFRKHHTCPCGLEWWDEWDCLCNDRCPDCDTEVEPDDHEELGADDK